MVEEIYEKLDPLYEERMRALATLVSIRVLEDERPVQVTVQRQESDGTWIDTSTVLELPYPDSTELLVDVGQRLLISEV